MALGRQRDGLQAIPVGLESERQVGHHDLVRTLHSPSRGAVGSPPMHDGLVTTSLTEHLFIAAERLEVRAKERTERSTVMTERTPTTTLDRGYSSPDASAQAWSDGQRALEAAEVYWVVTVRPDGRPHVAPLLSAWLDGALYFCTGPEERKAKNLEVSSHCIVLTGTNRLSEGLDIVVEGDAVIVADDAKLQRLSDAFVTKYGQGWRYTVRDGALYHA